jgi:hypothetical protein
MGNAATRPPVNKLCLICQLVVMLSILPGSWRYLNLYCDFVDDRF